MPFANEGAALKSSQELGGAGEPGGDGRGRQGAHIGEMQRRRLLAAMVEVLDDHRFEGATVGRICTRAGVSRRTFYDLFEDREARFLDAFQHAVEHFAEKPVAVFAGDGGWRERVRAALAALLEDLDAEPGVARMCVVETPKGGPEVLLRRRSIIEVLTVAVDQARREAKGAGPSSLTAESIVGGALSVLHARLLERDPGPLLELVNPLMSMIVLPIFGTRRLAQGGWAGPVPVPRGRPRAPRIGRGRR